MKAQERHELRENDLASWLQYGLWAFIRQNGSYILLVLALGFLGFQIWNLVQRRHEIARLQAWSDYNTLPHREDLFPYVLQSGAAMNDPANQRDADARKRATAEFQASIDLAKERPTRLREIIDAHDIKPLQAACYLSMADFYRQLLLLPEVMNELKLNRGEILEKQAQAYQGALNAMPDDTLISAQSHLGLAGTLEDRGDWDKAKDEYKLLTAKGSKYADTPWADFAADRAAELEARQKAPRLAAMIPLPTAPKPEINPLQGIEGLLNPTTRASLPSLPGLMLDPGPVTTSPAATSPAWQPSFGGLNLPQPIGPSTPAPKP